MVDYIDREKEIKSWEKAKENAPDEHYPVDEIISSLRIAPSIDVVEVVRCKDCKYRDKTYCAYLARFTFDKTECRYIKVSDKDYCAWGEKK